MTKGHVRITETILRDAHQSLLATRMRTEDMLCVAEKLDQVGYFSLEAWGGATFDTALRFLDECPWERLRSLRVRVRKTPLQMLLRGQNLLGYRHYPDDVVEAFVKYAVQDGIRVIRIFDALNDVRNMRTAIKAVLECGAHAQGAICYTTSPVHNIEYFVKVAEELVNEGVHSICIKDMAGLIDPYGAAELITQLKANFDVPISLHTHYTSGMGSMAYLKAIEAGVDIVDTALSSLAMGSSQPPTEPLVAALRGTPYDTGLDLNLLTEINRHFANVRERYSDVAAPVQVNTEILTYQVPGGMLSNLRSQLAQQGLSHKLQEVFEEVPRVRADLGYPPLVTPMSQIVGTQAVLNVVSGERYSICSKEIRDYVRGLYGRPPAPISDEVRKKIIGDEEVFTGRPADLLEPGLEKAREEIKEYARQEQDVLSYVLFPNEARAFLERRAAKS
ncbi:MAG: oxaloacetate decarboxylase subunit alpha [Firmicutes bacterium]|jgi:oxaloacetate decarboxylase alpha subunit|nr:oxaloacetate decarboxylase subunit alpha [Bacillota bacterium]